MAHRAVATALERFERLECSGLWQESPDNPQREIILSFGKCVLLLSDLNDDILGQWHLLAIDRINPNQYPARYSPDSTYTEYVEVKDPTMIAAIEDVRPQQRVPPVPRRFARLKTTLYALSLFCLLITGSYFGVPQFQGLLEEQLLRMTPPFRVSAIDNSLLAEFTKFSGPICDEDQTEDILESLTDRLVPNANLQISIVNLGEIRSAHLPGGRILLDRTLVSEHMKPDVAAGFIVMEFAAQQNRQMLRELIRYIGIWHTTAFLLGADIPPELLGEFAGQIPTLSPAPRNPNYLKALLYEAGLSGTPLAESIGPEHQAERTLTISGQSAQKVSDQGPILSAANWRKLKSSCTV